MDDSVTACDMKSLPVDGNQYDVGVFCLSLMSRNYADYLKEASRVLKPKSFLYVVEPKSKWIDGGKLDELKKNVIESGFKYHEPEIRNDFIYFEFLNK